MGQMTEKQAGLLQKHRWYNDGLSFDEASNRIDQIAKNNWKKPANPVPFKAAGTPATSAKPPQRSTRPAAPARRPAPAPTQDAGDELSPRVVAVLIKFGYEPADYTKQTAAALLDELRANDWQPLDDTSEPADEGDQYADDIPF